MTIVFFGYIDPCDEETVSWETLGHFLDIVAKVWARERTADGLYTVCIYLQGLLRFRYELFFVAIINVRAFSIKIDYRRYSGKFSLAQWPIRRWLEALPSFLLDSQNMCEMFWAILCEIIIPGTAKTFAICFHYCQIVLWKELITIPAVPFLPDPQNLPEWRQNKIVPLYYENRIIGRSLRGYGRNS